MNDSTKKALAATVVLGGLIIAPISSASASTVPDNLDTGFMQQPKLEYDSFGRVTNYSVQAKSGTDDLGLTIVVYGDHC